MEGTIRIEGAKIIFRNFSGAPTKFNAAGGKRSFSLLLDDEKFVKKIQKDGWEPKPLKPRDDSDEPHWHLPVTVRFDRYPPKVVMVKGRSKTQLSEDTVGMLDWANIENVDVAVIPYHYTHPARSGVSAYLKTMYVTIEEDEFEAKYAGDSDDLPWD